MERGNSEAYMGVEQVVPLGTGCSSLLGDTAEGPIPRKGSSIYDPGGSNGDVLYCPQLCPPKLLNRFCCLGAEEGAASASHPSGRFIPEPFPTWTTWVQVSLVNAQSRHGSVTAVDLSRQVHNWIGSPPNFRTK